MRSSDLRHKLERSEHAEIAEHSVNTEFLFQYFLEET